MFKRNLWICFVLISLCLTGYIISRSVIAKKIVEKKFVYASETAGDLEMVWGTMGYKKPPSLPPDSYEKDGMIFTKVPAYNDKFQITIKLPAGYEIYYWMVQRKDKAGNVTDIWDAGGNQYNIYRFTDPSIFKPGYFIFLAGFLPLLFLFFKYRNTVTVEKKPQQFIIKDYIPQFDCIRAIAVLLVIVHHWIIEYKNLGGLGVNLFFVLSGFLITRILLKGKVQTDNLTLSKGTAFKNFYIRRTLRIFPIYYLLLLIFLITGFPELQKNGIYYFTYTSNILFYTREYFPIWLSHLWSLAVEEQFYIIWPWLMILVNKKYLPWLIAMFILIGISSNYIFIDKGWWVHIFTPACFDAFAMGGFLSWITIYRQDVISILQNKVKWIFSAILLLFALDFFKLSFLPERTLHALLGVSLIYYCLFKNNLVVANFILNNKWLIRLGKVSYGVYLYHLFIPDLWAYILKQFASRNIDLFYNTVMPEAIKPVWLLLQEFGFLILISIISWKLIEKPMNGLKKRFENRPSDRRSEIEKAQSNTFSY